MSGPAIRARPMQPHRTDSLLPAHERESITNVPVTPAFGAESRNSQNTTTPGRHSFAAKDYFAAHSRSTDSTTRPSRDAHKQADGNFLSATFTIPYVVQRGADDNWQLDQRCQRSVHLDCLTHLSSNKVPQKHLIIAWTGEIEYSKDAKQKASANSSPKLAGQDGHSSDSDDACSENIYIRAQDQDALEKSLYNCDEAIVPVWLSQDGRDSEGGLSLRDQSKWRKYAEHDIFPLFHYQQRDPTGGVTNDIRWKDYYKANLAFADKICETYQPGDIVLVHDYYLMLVPRMIRERLRDVKIAFVLQTPFPTSEFVRCLERRKEILEGVLGADLVVFQAYIYSQHFTNSCARILNIPTTHSHVEVNGRHVRLQHLPGGVDISKILRHAFTPTVDRGCEKLASSFGDKKIILGHDPMHSLSGLDKKLQAYGKFLHEHPEWVGKIVLVQITSQAVLEVEGTEEADFSANVNVLVSNINATHGSLNYTPIQLLPQPQSEEEHFALLRQSDMALITSVREGISSTALEYAICQRDNHGTLIVSEFSGTATALGSAILINPWDTSAVAGQIHNALVASCEQRKARHDALSSQAQEMGVDIWAKRLLSNLEGVSAPKPITKQPISEEPASLENTQS